MKKILVTGASGLVGSRVVELLDDRYQFLTPDITELDLLNETQVKDYIEKHPIAAVIHLAAFTDINAAQKQKEGGDLKGTCWQLNVQAVGFLLDGLDLERVHFIHISTDAVFSGQPEDPGPYAEDHPIEKDLDKLTWYGATKAQTEELVHQHEGPGRKLTIVRINYPVRAHYEQKLDYLRKHLTLYQKGELYPLFNDQQFSITFIDEVALALEKIIDRGLTGTFHVSCPQPTTPLELISEFIRKAEGQEVKLDSKPLGELARRYPPKSGLRVEKTQAILGVKFRTWQEILDELIKQGVAA